jgi:hypothetical protein
MLETMLRSTVDISKLSLRDWLNIAQTIGNAPHWGYFKWRESVSEDSLKQLNLEGWEAIAVELNFDKYWAHYQYQKHSQ